MSPDQYNRALKIPQKDLFDINKYREKKAVFNIGSSLIKEKGIKKT